MHDEAERPALVGGEDGLRALVAKWRKAGEQPVDRQFDINYRFAMRACADDLEAALSLPAAQDGVTFLCDGTRFKLCPTKGGAAFFNFPAELAGKWVALVDATDNRHMRPTPNAIRGDKGAEAVAWQRVPCPACGSDLGHHEDCEGVP